MSIADNLSEFKFGKQNFDIGFLKKTEIGDIVIKGLSETYLAQPQNPTKFLANWLLNEHRSYLIKEKQQEVKVIEKESVIKNNKKIRGENIKLKIKKEKLLKICDDRENFLKFIDACEDIEEIMDELCERTEKLLNATGVYVFYYDKKRKSAGKMDDEFAHQTEQEVYRLIAFSDSHKELLTNKFLDEGEGIIQDIFIPKEDDVPVDNNPDVDNDNDEPKEKIELPLSKTMKHILIDEMVRNPKAKFFREPRLGCFFGLDFTYDSCINETSLQSSIDMLREFEEEKRNIEEEKQIKLEELKDLARNNGLDLKELEVEKSMINDESGKSMMEGIVLDESVRKVKEKNEEIEKLSKILLEANLMDGEGNPMDIEAMIKEITSRVAEIKEFEKKEKKFVFALDTLGQDRMFSEEDRNYVFQIVKKIIDTRSEQEKQRMLQMRDLRIKNLQDGKSYLDINTFEKIQEADEGEFKRYYNEKYEDNPPKDDEDKEDEILWSKSRFILKMQLQEDEILNGLFKNFAKYEFVEFERIFQNIMYFTGFTGKQINFPDTNKLNWKVARHLWNDKILNSIIDYVPVGPKPVHENELTTINRLLNIFAEVEDEKLKEYSYVIGRIVDAIKTCK
jgi:hypothetical protein